MKMLKTSLVTLGAVILMIPAATQLAVAQPAVTESDTDVDNLEVLEEVVVTGRKREESLKDVPVAISVWSAKSLKEQMIITQRELFDATPGLTYDTFTGDRNSSQPGIRGVQSNEIATTQQKVNSFIDGLPLLGQAGSLSFWEVDRVEIYRGPQSAAFGRSTFAGAINYITPDATKEFSGKIQARVSDLGALELGVALSGPIGDKLGYRISYYTDQFDGPDEWTSSDGYKLGSTKAEYLTAKLNFQFGDNVYGEVMYMGLNQDDRPSASWLLDPAKCSGDSGYFLFQRGGRVELPSGAWDCDPSTNGPERNYDAIGQFSAQYNDNIDAYSAAYPGFDTNGNGVVSLDEFLSFSPRWPFGTLGQRLIGLSVTPTVKTDRDRFQGEVNFELGDSLLKFMGMYATEKYQRVIDRDGTGSLAVWPGFSSVNAITDPTTIDEQYAEVRWVSPGDRKFRYTLSASYYGYDFLTRVFANYGALTNGLTRPNGTPITPLQIIVIATKTTNYGASFGLMYDLSERTTLSFEGRYQSDQNCGEDEQGNNGAGIKRCSDTKSFAPRIAINTAISDNHSIYAQASRGTNPAGVNISYADDKYIEVLQVVSGQIPSPWDNFTYDGSDGVHFPTVGYNADTFATYKEEVLTNFEIGSKGRYAGGRGTYNAALYYMLWKDQVSARDLNWDDTGPNGWNAGNKASNQGAPTRLRTFLNEGDAELYGLELDTTFALTDIWLVGGSLTLGKAKYKDFCSPAGPLYTNAAGKPLFPILTPEKDGVVAPCSVVDGNTLPRQSDITGTFFVSATLPNDFLGMLTSFRADVRSVGSNFTDSFNLIKRSAVTTLNLSASMRSEKLSLRFYINNVTDVDDPLNLYVATFFTDNANPTIQPKRGQAWGVVGRRPREFGITGTYYF